MINDFFHFIPSDVKSPNKAFYFWLVVDKISNVRRKNYDKLCCYLLFYC